MKPLKQPKTKATIEFGDFQTPTSLALKAAMVARRMGFSPTTILEPSCGKGAFVEASAVAFPNAKKIIGADVNQEYLEGARESVTPRQQIEWRHADFFRTDWGSILSESDNPLLIVGNPPWVTSSVLGGLQSTNLPDKKNLNGLSGIAAITGKSNFDISEWMLLRYLDWLQNRTGGLAVLCKTSVARKILLRIWKQKYPLKSAKIYKIDALENFGAAVDACFFVAEKEKASVSAFSCDLFDTLDSSAPSRKWAFHDGHIVQDDEAYQRQRELLGPETRYIWRSGVKHDCSKIMELVPIGTSYVNGEKELVEIEETHLFPMLKSSDVGNGRSRPRAMMLITQAVIGEETGHIEHSSPKTWKYLKNHADSFDRRGSSIYRGKPRFSIFGVGPYSFAPWKIAISGFYKKLLFTKIGPVDGKPVMMDDTIYFLACGSEGEADFLLKALTSSDASEFYRSMINWDEKRPVTAEVLKRLSIEKLAMRLGLSEDYARYTAMMLNAPLFSYQRNAA
jgi:methylase of polypeptide subunit release factors